MPSPRNLGLHSDLRSGPSAFSTTHWTIVLSAKDGTSVAAKAALETLCRNYWPPLYAFLRRDGFTPHDAEDLVQGFFERLLAKEYLQEVRPEKGRFRSFLLTSLRNFVSNQRRADACQRRSGYRKRLEADFSEIEVLFRTELSSNRSPEMSYDRRWAMMVMERARRRLEEDQREAGRSLQFELFRTLLFVEPSDEEYAAIRRRFGLNRTHANVVVHRLRKRFRDLLRDEIIHTVSDSDELDAEYRYLLAVLAQQ
jgi:RNA polymerase sigma factor (sigma-70 family)